MTVIGEYSECYSCTGLCTVIGRTLVLAKPAALSQSYCDEDFNHEGWCKKKEEVAMREYVEYENAENYCSDTDKLTTCGNKSTTCSEERQRLWE